MPPVKCLNSNDPYAGIEFLQCQSHTRNQVTTAYRGIGVDALEDADSIVQSVVKKCTCGVVIPDKLAVHPDAL